MMKSLLFLLLVLSPLKTCKFVVCVVMLLGLVSTVAGGGGSGDGVGGMATFNGPYGVAVTSIGDVIVADSYNSNIRKIVSSGLDFDKLKYSLLFLLLVLSPLKKHAILLCFCLPLGIVSTVAGGVGSTLSGYVDGVGTLARFNNPSGLAVTSTGDVIVADHGNNILRKITSTGG